jgi:hypothetical protein
MEGNSIQRLMGRGVDIFADVFTFIKGWLTLGAEELEADAEPIILDDEVDEVCRAFGRVLRCCFCLYEYWVRRRSK